MQCRASLTVRGSLRQSHLHGLSRQHTAIRQTSSSFILIVPGFPCLLFGFHLFVFSLTAQSRGMPLLYWHCHLHRSPCSCSAQCTLPILDFQCHLCDEGKGLLLLPCSSTYFLVRFSLQPNITPCGVAKHPNGRTFVPTNPSQWEHHTIPQSACPSDAVPPCTALASLCHVNHWSSFRIQ